MGIIKEPKVFISYSWTNQTHQERVKYWADRLIEDGVEVIIDIYDLKEGDDKYAFMEKMVNDPEVTHVLVVCDSLYAEKANARKAGVGTESQIISEKIYNKANQSKFIPILCDFDDDGEPILPTFIKSRIWIDFSSPEAVNKNWEQLLRILYNKPQHIKPEKGKAPTFITNDVPIPTNKAYAKFNLLKQAIIQDKKGMKLYRRDFIDACISYADSLRVRTDPQVKSMEEMGEKVLEDCKKLKEIRDYLCDWVLLESEISNDSFLESLIDVLEQLRELKSRPSEIDRYNDTWFEAHSVFVYETFLYIVAALLKSGAYSALNEVFTSYYQISNSAARYGQDNFERFNCFYGYSRTLQILAAENKQLLSPAAELIKRQADREDIPFSEIRQAELLVLLMRFIITPEKSWYPQTLLYSSYTESFPFFIKATLHKNFSKLAKITGISDVNELREKAKNGYDIFNNTSQKFEYRHDINLWHSMNMDKLDSLS